MRVARTFYLVVRLHADGAHIDELYLARVRIEHDRRRMQRVVNEAIGMHARRFQSETLRDQQRHVQDADGDAAGSGVEGAGEPKLPLELSSDAR
jgi:hypothetical protein